MPIDPRIPLAVGSPQMPDYASQYGQVLQLREMIRLADDRQLERDRLAEEEELRQRMKGAYAFDPEGNLDRPTTLKNFRDIDPVTALTLQQGWKTGDVAARLQKFKMDKAEQDAELSELVTAQKTMELAAKLAGSATDDASFKLAQQEGLKHGVLTQEEVDQYPEFNTKAVLWLKQKQEQVRTAAERIQARQDDIVRTREKTEYEQGQLANAMELGGQLAPVIDSQESLDLFHKQTGGLLKDFIGDVYNPDTTQPTLADITKTPQERAAEEHRRLTRVETERHHLETTAAARRRTKQDETFDRGPEITSLRSEVKDIGNRLDVIHARRTLLGKGLETGMYYPKSGKPEEMDFSTFRGKDTDEAKAVKAEIGALLTEATMLTKKRNIKVREIRVFEEEAGATPTDWSKRATASATPTGKPRRIDAKTGRTTGEAATEADIRRRAKEAGIDPDILVEDAKALGLLR